MIQEKNELFEYLKRKIDESKVVSFDIFDTLVFRNIQKPRDIFRLLEKAVQEKHKSCKFFQARINAEKEARKNVPNGECNLDDIYQALSKQFRFSTDWILEKELALEYDFSTVNPFMKKVFEYAQEQNKRVFLISDMYLSSEFVQKLLEKSGYTSYPFELFVSNEHKKNKGSGELFSLVMEKYSLDPNTWFHIGDNYKSDYLSPRALGIKAYAYKNVSTYTSTNSTGSIADSIMEGITNNLLYNGFALDYWEEFGIHYAAPIYLGFTTWLYQLTKDKDNLYFLARDGYIIHKLYQKIAEINNNDIYTDYVYCSRQSVQMPAMANCGALDDFVDIVSIRHAITDNDQTIKSFLGNAKINTQKISDKILKNFGFSSWSDVVTQENYYNAKKLLAYYAEDARSVFLDKHKMAIKYLKQCRMNQWKKINVMDVGWSGHIQDSIEKLLEIPCCGYYFGTIHSHDIKNYCNMFGWAFDFNNPVRRHDYIFENVMMFELLFSAPHGSCTGYKKEGNRVEPIFKNNLVFNDIVTKFQEAALKVSNIALQYFQYFDAFTPDYCLAAYFDFIARRSKEDMVQFSKLSNDVAIGNEKQYPYVVTIGEEDLKNGFEEAKKKMQFSNWPNTFVLDPNIPKSRLKLLEYNAKCNLFADYYRYDLSCFKIYFAVENDLNEQDVAIVRAERFKNHYSICFESELAPQYIRVDPVEEHSVRMSDIEMKIDGVSYKPIAHNADETEDTDVLIFSTKDPWLLYAPADRKCTKIEFEAKIDIID